MSQKSVSLGFKKMLNLHTDDALDDAGVSSDVDSSQLRGFG
jgi:hypothetical protein